MAKQFQKLADALNEDFRFAHTNDAAVLEEYSETKYDYFVPANICKF